VLATAQPWTTFSSIVLRLVTAGVCEFGPRGTGRRSCADFGGSELVAPAFDLGRNHVEINLVALGNLPREIVEWHQQPGGEHIGLVFDLAVFAVPADDILFAAPYAVRIGKPVNQVMPERVREGEADAPF
jgi:hypothetical protein